MVIGAGWAGARAMTSTSGPGISLMGDSPGLAYYAEVPASSSTSSAWARRPACRRARRRAISSTAHAVAWRHEADPADPGVGRRVLHDGDGRVRPRRALPDARLRDERSRPRHEHLDVEDVRVSRAPLDRGKRARRRRRSQRLGEWGRYKDVDGDGIPYRTFPATDAGVFHARFRPQREGPVQRAAGRLRAKHGAAGAQVRDGAQARAEADGRRRAGAEIGIIGYGTQPLGDRGEPRSARARSTGSRPRTCGCARIRSPRS